MLSPEILQKIQTIYIKSRFMANDVFAGEYETAFRGRGMEFEEVREYMPGDDIRAIDWNVTARMNQPFVKIFREEREQTMMLMVDASASEHFGSGNRRKLDLVTEIAAVLAFAAIKSNDKVGLIIFTDRVEHFIAPKKGRAHVWRVISEILSFQPEGRRTNMEEALVFLSQVIHRRSICFMISDFHAQHYMQRMKIVRQKHDLIALCIQDPLEQALPRGGLITFQDLESGAELVVDLSSTASRQQFAQLQAQRLNRLERAFHEFDIDALFLNAHEDYINTLLKFFRLREKRL